MPTITLTMTHTVNIVAIWGIIIQLYIFRVNVHGHKYTGRNNVCSHHCLQRYDRYTNLIVNPIEQSCDTPLSRKFTYNYTPT